MPRRFVFQSFYNLVLQSSFQAIYNYVRKSSFKERWPVSQKILSPLVILSMAKTMVTMVISELKFISRLKIFRETEPWPLVIYNSAPQSETIFMTESLGTESKFI